jgi:hypothetical protein
MERELDDALSPPLRRVERGPGVKKIETRRFI